jgi:hypothetical protein
VTAPTESDAVLEKGTGPQLGIVARRDGEVFAIHSGDRVHPGDQIRFVLRDVRHPFALIASVDGVGHPNVYLPYDGASSMPVEAGERREIDGSIVLDGALGPERVYALFSRKPLTASAVRAALASIGRRGASAIRDTSVLPLITDAQSSVLLEKVAR